MKEIKYTITQQEIIKTRKVLADFGYMLLNGFAFDNGSVDLSFDAKVERVVQESLCILIEDCAKRRKEQQETFDRMPWLANECGRV